MKAYIIFVLIIGFAVSAFAQDQKDNSEKNSSRLKFSESKKTYINPSKKPAPENADLVPEKEAKSNKNKISVIQNYPLKMQKVKAQPAIGKASSSGLAEEMKKMSVQPTITREDLLKLQGKSVKVAKKAQK